MAPRAAPSRVIVQIPVQDAPWRGLCPTSRSAGRCPARAPRATGCPPRTSAPSCTRHAPQAARARPRGRGRGRRRPACAPRPATASASADDTNATSADRPYTPARLAVCTIGDDAGLARSQQHPWEPAENPAARQLGRHPHGRRHEHARRPDPRADARHHDRHKRRKQRKVRDQQAARRDGERQADAAERPEHVGRPVERAAEVDRARPPGRARTRGAGACPPVAHNATSSGDSATHATAGWPNRGKLRASRTPERMASG